MKNFVLQLTTFLILIGNSLHTEGQVKVGSFKKCGGERLTELDYERLKECTLYFVVPNYLTEDREEFTKIIKASWTYCDIKVIETHELEKYEYNDNSAFMEIRIFTESLFDSPFSTFSYITFEMNLVPIKGNLFGFKEYIYLGCFQLIPGKQMISQHYENRSVDLELKKIIYEGPLDIINFKPGLVASYLKNIEFGLKERVSMCEDGSNIVKKTELRNLVEDTLYITENLINEGDKFTEEEFIKTYPYPYKFITFDALEEMLLSKKQFYYYISHSYISVCNSQTGEILYWTGYWKPQKILKVKKKNLSGLAKAIAEMSQK